MSAERFKSSMFDEKRCHDRAAVAVKNIRAALGTHCVGVDLSKVTDGMLANCVLPVLTAYDDELGALWAQYRDAEAKLTQAMNAGRS